MTRNKKIISTLILAVILFGLSLFYVRNEVCCSFSSSRNHGFPYQIISISKVTPDWEEAKKVYSLSDSELLSQGWKLRINSGFNWLPKSISFNFIFYLVIGRGLIFIFERIKRSHDQK